MCQSKTSQKLQNATEKGLTSLESDLKDLEQLGALPFSIDLRRLDDGSGFASTLLSHNAVYHKTCRSACNSTHVKRARSTHDREGGGDISGGGGDGTKKLRSSSFKPVKQSCVVCEDTTGELHKVSTLNVDVNLKEWATKTKNFLLHARLITDASDAHAGDKFYHTSCYIGLQRAAAKAGLDSTTAASGPALHPYDAMVTAQLVFFMSESGGTFKLVQLQSLYKKKLEELGRTCPQVNPTRFKEHLLHHLPTGWDSFSKGRDVFLSHSDTVGEVLSHTVQKLEINQDDALLLVKAAGVLRRHVLASQDPFTGSFSSDCLTRPVPEPFLTFMNVLLQGPKSMEGSSQRSERDADMGQRSKVASGLCQLITYNVVKCAPSALTSLQIRHRKERETPLPLYIGIKLHCDARLKHLVETFHRLGISVSYDRVREVKTAVARAVCKRIENNGVVLPNNMRSGVFTSGDFDNLDHKKTSNLSNAEFHGVAITLTNHLSHENMGLVQEPVVIDPNDTSKPKLPDHYVIVPPVELNSEDLIIPRGEEHGPVRPSHDQVLGSRVRDEAWISHVVGLLSTEELEKGDVVTWSGFHSQRQDPDSIKPAAEIGILPLFPDKSTDPSIVKHVMLVVKKSIEFLNPGQTPVLGADQPLYAISKRLQWKFPSILGEDKYVLMMGALHIEDKVQLMVGKLIRGSGWEWALSKAEVFTSGRASSTLDDHHIKRTRYAHQVSVVALSLLKQEAYAIYSSEVQGLPQPFELWNRNQVEGIPMFKYWSEVIELELLLCRFVRSLREGDFDLYVQVLDELCPWFFVFDHTNYARWLPVHVKDLVELPEKHPEVYREFKDGNFVVQRSCHKFSLIAKDQSHEQSNKKLQAGGGGLSDMYDDPDSIALYMLAGPDTVRLLEEFESVQSLADSSVAHHEESPSLQYRFIKDVTNFADVLRECGNPFLETSQDLVTLDSHDVMEQEVVRSLNNVKETGIALHANYVQTRIDTASVPITNTIKRNGMYTFANPPDTRSKKDGKLGVAKKNSVLITQLFLSLQSRPDADMSEFFRFENQREPPSLSDRGMLRSGTKSHILKCLGAPTSASAGARHVTVQVLDMAAVVHMVCPSRSATFRDYVPMHLIPFLNSQLTTSVERVDAVWDTYPEKSLKLQTQLRRGSGPRTQIGQNGNTPIPKRDWQKYLTNTENKREFFAFCSQKLAETKLDDILIVTTQSESVLSNIECDLSGLLPCNHAEADSRIILHLAHASRQGHRNAYVRTVDSDVVVLAIAFFEQLNLSKLWIGLGSGKNYRDIPIHDLQLQLGPARSKALPLFHALSGCDTTSQLLGCGKKTAWAAWQSMPEMTDVLNTIMESPETFAIDSAHMKKLERFHVLMYSKTCSAATVNEARKDLFSHGARSLEAIPPTQAALFEHIKRSILQACFIWKQSASCHQNIPDFGQWGWELDEKRQEWAPFWTTLADASNACALLLHCGCQKACQGNCKCSKAGVRCTALCKCDGGCANNDYDE